MFRCRVLPGELVSLKNLKSKSTTFCIFFGSDVRKMVAAKLIPVGYGIKKLTIMMTIVDDLVSVDNLIEDHLTSEPNNEYIQSVDIVAFNKI